LKHASFPMIISNYDFSHTPMEGKTIPYKVIKKGDIKVGILAVGIELAGLVPDNLYGNTIYNDPVRVANETAAILKEKEDCDMIICLSHLGDKYSDNKVSDEILARETSNIDLIIGGHTHRFFDEPRRYKNKQNADVLVNQVGWAGIQLGRLDFIFQGKRKKNLANAQTVIIGKKSSD
jgi:5'-nucleotidase